jgi:hypothetical protein
MLNAIQQVADDLGHEPTQSEYRNHPVSPSISTLWNRFGGWAEAKEQAGVGGNLNMTEVNSEYFSQIDTSEKAYWLGMMYADGCVTTQGDDTSLVAKLTLAEQDVNTVQAFKDAIDSGHAVAEITKPDGCQNQVSLTVTDTRFCEHLIYHGVVRRKSHKDTFPELSEAFRPAFIRGYFDGDGSISKSKNRNSMMVDWSITGASRNRIESLFSWLQELGVRGGSCFACGDGSHKLSVKALSDLKRVWDAVWPEGTDTEPAMRRKKRDFHAFIGGEA